MPSANVELVRSIFAAWERGDFSSAEWADPEIEFVLTGGGPRDGSWTGVAGMAEGFSGWLDAWEEYRAEAEEYTELDDERVLVFVHQSGRGKTSGLDLAQVQMGVVLFHVHDGRVTSLVLYPDRDRALADLGLA
jgi:ketosteroid isomerase-like protein